MNLGFCIAQIFLIVERALICWKFGVGLLDDRIFEYNFLLGFGHLDFRFRFTLSYVLLCRLLQVQALVNVEILFT